MADCIPHSMNRRAGGFGQVVDAFLAEPGLPFARLICAERIERIFTKHGGLFGLHGVYTTAIMVWSFLGQVLRDGKQASSSVSGTAWKMTSRRRVSRIVRFDSTETRWTIPAPARCAASAVKAAAPGYARLPAMTRTVPRAYLYATGSIRGNRPRA